MLARLTPLVLSGALILPVHAEGVFTQGDALLLQTSLWTVHYSPEPEHNNHQKLINVEWLAPKTDLTELQRPGGLDWRDEVRWLAGVASFDNSFSQRSTYVYGGGRYDFPLQPQTQAYVKVTAGLLHGYKDEYRDKIPFNRFEIAPAILPAVGLEYHRLNLELIPFGTAGAMVNLGFYLR